VEVVIDADGAADVGGTVQQGLVSLPAIERPAEG